MSVLQLVRVVTGVAAAGRAAGPQYTEDAHVVLDAGNLRRRTVLDHGLNLLDVAVALGTLAQHDCRMTFAIDMAGRQEGWIQDVDRHSVLVRDVGETLQFVDRGVQPPIRNLSGGHDILDAPPAKRAEVRFEVAWLASSATASASSRAAFGRRRRALPSPRPPRRRLRLLQRPQYAPSFHESSLGCGSGCDGWVCGGHGRCEGARGEELASIHGDCLPSQAWIKLSVIVRLFRTLVNSESICYLSLNYSI